MICFHFSIFIYTDHQLLICCRG